MITPAGRPQGRPCILCLTKIWHACDAPCRYSRQGAVLLLRCLLLLATGSGSILLLLAGCAPQQPFQPSESQIAPPSIVALQSRIATYNEWDLRARIALRHRQWSWRGTLQWMRRANSFRMTFNDLLGRRLLLIESQQGGGVVAVDAKGNRRQAQDAAALLEPLLGAEIRLDNLYYWLLGAPKPNVAYSQLKFNPEGQLEFYQQDQWEVAYSAYYQDRCRAWLPRNLTLSQSKEQSPTRTATRLSLRIQSWQTAAIESTAC